MQGVKQYTFLNLFFYLRISFQKTPHSFSKKILIYLLLLWSHLENFFKLNLFIDFNLNSYLVKKIAAHFMSDHNTLVNLEWP